MKTACTLVLIALTGAAALGSDGPRTEINPALLYYQAFLLAPEPLSVPDSDYIFSREGRGENLPERFAAIIAGYDSQFTLVRQAAASTAPCDWGIDLTRGPATLLPHLARCKAVAQATRLRVMWDLQHGQQAEARDDLLAGFALARNTSRDGTLISVLVQIASEAIHCSTITENFGQFDKETLKAIVDELDAAPAGATVAESMGTEKAYFHDWLVNKILDSQKENAGNDAKVMAEIHKLFASVESNEAGQTDVWGPVFQAAGGSSAGILKLLSEEEQLYTRLATIMALPRAEYDTQSKQFTAELRATVNPLVSVSFPAYEKARQREFKMQVRMAMIHAATEYKLNGQAGVQSVPDPFGAGPFEFKRFVFEGIDRGFQLKSAYTGSGFPEVLIFVEKQGPGFRVDGPEAGQTLSHAPAAK